MELLHLSPILWTKNLGETVSFYETVLGFQGKSDFPNFASLTKGNVEIMFVVPQDEVNDCEGEEDNQEFFPKPLLTGGLFIVTDEVDGLWASVKDRAVVKTAIEDRAYLMRDFSILDNNGYELVFGQDISNRST
jgi:catechol 2,3-dioxygenase-like lactoylglutathione lyase family enzyme